MVQAGYPLEPSNTLETREARDSGSVGSCEHIASELHERHSRSFVEANQEYQEDVPPVQSDLCEQGP